LTNNVTDELFVSSVAESSLKEFDYIGSLIRNRVIELRNWLLVFFKVLTLLPSFAMTRIENAQAAEKRQVNGINTFNSLARGHAMRSRHPKTGAHGCSSWMIITINLPVNCSSQERHWTIRYLMHLRSLCFPFCYCAINI